jgi:hypothetical protein
MEQKLADLLNVPFDKRSQQWDQDFLIHLRNSKVTVMNPEPLTGPDHWPYLHARIDETSTEPAIRVLDWLSQKGIGLVLDHSDHQEYPDAILTWGMVWQLVKKGTVHFPHESESNLKTTPVQFDWKQIHRSGDPNEDYLPKLVRKVLREFFAEQEILTPRILVYTLDGQNFEIAFSVESLGNPPPSEHEGILEAIAWFLPPHYQISLVSEKGAPPFVLL